MKPSTWIAAAVALAPALLLAGQEEAALSRKCDSQIPWITDGVELADGSLKAPESSGADRVGLLEQAKRSAQERNRLILWYCMRVPGTHTTRAAVLDAYARVALFTDPGLVDLLQSKFIPLRMASDDRVSAKTGSKAFEFLEPGFVVLTPDGEVVHRLDRIRTFNADWVRAALIAVLRRHPKYNAPAGDSVEALLRGGDDETAFERATADQKALIYRRAGKFREVLALPCAPVHQGIALLGLQDFEGARKILEREDSAEAAYHLAALLHWTGKDPRPVWTKLVRRNPESPWAWRAAANLARGRDGLPQGPMAHHYEDFFLRPPSGVPTSTRLPGEEFDPTVRRAVEFLLRAQREDGSWNDARYSYGWAKYIIKRRVKEGLLDPGYSSWPDTTLQPNVYMAVTALASLALLEWRDVQPARVDVALLRAEAYLLDESRLAPGKCEECYAYAYRLLYWARKKDVPRMNRLVKRLYELQDEDGFWGHEYPNSFATAAVVRTLSLARQAGADVPDPLLGRAADALLKTREGDGRQAYRHEPGKPPSSEKNSMGRMAPSELALFECGRGTLENVASAMNAYWKHLDRLEAVRLCDHHADEELAGFFYFNSVFHTLEAARALPETVRKEHLRKFRAQILSIPEWDGSFLDSHELGKSYGTSMALLILSRLRTPAEPPQVVDLWPGKPPGDVGIAGEERFFEHKVNGKVYEVGGKPTRWLTNVTKPTITVYRPAKDKDTGVSMLICPGGGYHNLGWDVEGEEVAAWLNSIGITGILLKYRCPRRPGDVKGEPPAGPLKDAQRAVRLVRSKAAEWGIDPGKIGMVGFSAGGHLVGATATNFEQATYEPIDEIDQVSCRPDFAVMLYSGYFKVKDGLSPTIREEAKTPPLFLVHATDDGVADVEHSVTMYLAMKRAKVPVELHVFATGGHGFAARKVEHPCVVWTDLCIAWLRKQGILKP